MGEWMGGQKDGRVDGHTDEGRMLVLPSASSGSALPLPGGGNGGFLIRLFSSLLKRPQSEWGLLDRVCFGPPEASGSQLTCT